MTSRYVTLPPLQRIRLESSRKTKQYEARPNCNDWDQSEKLLGTLPDVRRPDLGIRCVWRPGNRFIELVPTPTFWDGTPKRLSQQNSRRRPISPRDRIHHTTSITPRRRPTDGSLKQTQRQTQTGHRQHNITQHPTQPHHSHRRDHDHHRNTLFSTLHTLLMLIVLHRLSRIV
jgi:hypothetical protein